MSRKKTSHSPAQRRSEIARLASTIGLASVEELSERYGVTSSTIRRDLSRLEAEGLIARTYGGAIFISDENESPLQERQGEFFAAKKAIASWAAQRIKDHERVLFDGGSTVGALAATLGKRESLRVTAMGVNAINSLIDRDDIELSSPGGIIRPSSQSFVGPSAEAALQRETFDRAFLGADGVTAQFGLCEADPDQTRLKEIVASRSSDVYVLADGSKIGRRAFHHWAVLPTPWTLVTDDSAHPEEVAGLRAAGVTVEIVPTN